MAVDLRLPEPRGPRRFRALRVIGAGGMGVVYEAVDERHGGRVALKTLRTLDAEARIRFKNEFRRLSDIHHPNLVSLGELIEEDGRLFFTMELVHGVHLMQHVRPGAGQRPAAARPWRRADSSGFIAKQATRDPEAPWLVRDGEGFDEARIRGAFGQLVKGLHALHRAHKIHRDVKPTNVLVSEEGRVVIVDFGLLLDVERDPRDASIVGTAHYMAPEQAAGGPVGPEADWYGVGAMLYMALTGYYPFRVAPEAALELKQRGEPVPPGEVAEGPLPADLEALCVDLLRLDPAARPGAREILARLGAGAGRAGVDDEAEPASLSATPFVGRKRELEALGAALAEARLGEPVVVLIEGESGVGKSALARHFLDEDHGALVLEGRCYARESMPYKAVDEVVDALGQHLARLPQRELGKLLPADASLLGAVFPTLGRIEALASVGAADAHARGAPDPRENRAQVFAALRELLRRLGDRGPLVIAIDDLHWADADGLTLLEEVLRPPRAPALLLLATTRAEGAASPLPGLSVRRMRLDRLPAEDAQALAAELVAGAEGAASVEIDALLAETGGHPLFIDALLRHRLSQPSAGPVRLEDALGARIARLDPRARLLLELLAVAGRPLPLGVAARAASADPEELGRMDAALRALHLARAVDGAADGVLEPYHHRIGEAALAKLGVEERRALHGRLALALEESGSPELEAMSAHFRDAGDLPRAAGYAARAGDEAAHALAFDRAARLYRTALALAPEGSASSRALHEKLGDALANAGRGPEAATAYIEATRDDPAISPRHALELRRRAAESYLRSGYYDEGMSCLRDVLTGVGMSVPRTPSEALGRLLLRRGELRLRGLGFQRRGAGEIDPDELARIDVCWAAALGLGMIDNVRGAFFQSTHLARALDAGEPYRVARALALEVPFAAVPGTPVRRRALELLAEAHRVAQSTGHPHALALVRLVSGTSLYLVGRFPEALIELDLADTMLRETCTGVAWERGSGLTIGLWTRWFTGDLREFCRRVPLAIREAEERGDRYLATNLRSYFTNAHWLVQGDVEGAKREAALAIERWSKAGFHLQHMHDMVAQAHIALYEGQHREAHRALADRWPALTRSLSLRMQTARVHMIHLRARAALASAAELPARRILERRALLAEARRAARALRAEDVAWAEPLADTLVAGTDAIAGDPARALDALDRASRLFRALGMELFAAVARRRAGALLGGERGAALAGEATRWMRGQGVVDPDRMSAMLMPGFR